MACLTQMLQKWQTSKMIANDRYSVERLYACHQYTQTTSALRVVFVCVVSVLPPLFLIVLLDSLPLRDPAEGWKANWVLWVRQTFSTFTLSAGVSLELCVTAPAAELTVTKCAVIAFVSSVVYTGCAILIAKYIAYPTPFSFITTA